MTEFTPIIEKQYLVSGLLALVLWLLLTHSRRRVKTTSLAALACVVRLCVTYWIFASTLGLLSGLVQTVGNWPAWFLALSGAAATEAILWFYHIDVAQRSRTKAPYAMLSLRLGVVGLLVVLMSEPIMSHLEEREEERFVAILLDSSDSMDLKSRSASGGGGTRREVARRILRAQSGGDGVLLRELEQRYQVRLYQFGATARELPVGQLDRLTNVSSDGAQIASTSDGQESDAVRTWSRTTDMAKALQRIDNDLPLDDLSGVVILSDGCDHSTGDIQQVSRRLALHNVPINVVLIGDSSPVRDAAITDVQAPNQVYHGDTVALRVAIKADQYQGQSTKLRLLKDGEVIEEKVIAITSDRHRQSVQFEHPGEEAGLHEYTVELAPLAGEEAEGNNSVSRRVWVSKDHIRLLVIDDRPRWEFRYLRNLFGARDRTVFLQAVLLRPDRLAGVPAPPVMHASALRAFDDYEATALPQNEAEWLKFDTIVLGDVPLASLGEANLEILDRFVRVRGGTLIVISGQGHMPHAYARTKLSNLLPVRLNAKSDPPMSDLGDDLYFAAADGAEAHVIMQPFWSTSGLATNPFPPLSWQHPASEAKPGASVLAYARQGKAERARDRAHQRRNALMLWHRYGAGKVLQMTFDQSWRLRYGVGDRHHHRFWGGIVRWAVEDRLSVGTDLVRMGTDQLRYFSGDQVTVKARLLDGNRNPITDEEVTAVVYRGDEVVRRVSLARTPDESGIVQANLSDLDKSGGYRVELEGDVVERLLALERRTEKVAVQFSIDAPNETTESADIVADATVVSRLADWTDGVVTTPDDVQAALEALGPESTFQRRRWTVPLWNLWPVAFLFVACVCCEWLLRKWKGLV